MPQYLVSKHAVDQALERFPEVVGLIGGRPKASRWIGQLAQRARPVGNQLSYDLVLRVTVRLVSRDLVIYLPISPVGSADRWVVKTVLTEEQGLGNVDAARQAHRQHHDDAWRRRRGWRPRPPGAPIVRSRAA